jgi:hypothetical protein
MEPRRRSCCPHINILRLKNDIRDGSDLDSGQAQPRILVTRAHSWVLLADVLHMATVNRLCRTW